MLDFLAYDDMSCTILKGHLDGIVFLLKMLMPVKTLLYNRDVNQSMVVFKWLELLQWVKNSEGSLAVHDISIKVFKL